MSFHSAPTNPHSSAPSGSFGSASAVPGAGSHPPYSAPAAPPVGYPAFQNAAYGSNPAYGYAHDYSKLNTYAILAIVFAVLFAPLGIVFGALAMSAAKGVIGAPHWMKTLGSVGFWLSIALTAIPLLLALFGVLTFLVSHPW